jgi:hypothetical protein
VSVVLCIALSAAAGCATDDAEGSLSLNLVGQTPSGKVYRLRDAVITVHGPTSTTVWNTEDDPDRTSLSADVVVGDYSALLQDGWRIERVEGVSTNTLPSQLLSENPVLFSVASHQRTSVPLRFRVDNENVDFTQGYDLTLEVQEPLPPALFVADLGNDPRGIAVFSLDASGDTAPLRRIEGPSANLPAPFAVAVGISNEIVVADASRNAILVFPPGADGDVAPIRTIAGPATGLDGPASIAIYNREIYVIGNRGIVSIFPINANGNVAPTRSFGFDNTGSALTVADGVIFIANTGSQEITGFPAQFSGNPPVIRSLFGQVGELFCPVGLAVSNGELYVADGCLQGVRVFRADANNRASAVRTVAGLSTGFTGIGRIAVAGDRMYVTDLTSGTVRIFSTLANGNLSPLRVIGGPSTTLSAPLTPFVF